MEKETEDEKGGNKNEIKHGEEDVKFFSLALLNIFDHSIQKFSFAYSHLTITHHIESIVGPPPDRF